MHKSFRTSFSASIHPRNLIYFTPMCYTRVHNRLQDVYRRLSCARASSGLLRVRTSQVRV